MLPDERGLALWIADNPFLSPPRAAGRTRLGAVDRRPPLPLTSPFCSYASIFGLISSLISQLDHESRVEKERADAIAEFVSANGLSAGHKLRIEKCERNSRAELAAHPASAGA